MYPRNPGLFDNVPNPENLMKFANYEPDNKVIMNFAGYYDGYPPIYPPRMGFDYIPEYLENYNYEATEEFQSLLNNTPPGFTSDGYHPPPGFAKSVKTKAPNPNAVSFIPSFLVTAPIKDEKEEQDSKNFGVRGILALQKNLTDDKSSLAKGKDLTVHEGHKNALENYSSFLNSVFEQNTDSNLQADFSLPSSYYVSK